MLLDKIKRTHSYVNQELSRPKWEGQKSRTNYINVLTDMIKSRYKYNLSFNEYISLRFHELSSERRKQIITKRDRNEIIHMFNSQQDIPQLENKRKFLSNFKNFINRDFLILEETTIEEFSCFYSKHNGFIAKNSEGMQGKNIHVITETNNIEEEFENLKSNDVDIIEEISEAHPKLKELNPFGLPPIRIMTFIDKNGTAHIIASAIYLSTDDPVVNARRGASMALVNPKNGKVITDALTPEKKLIKKHLISNKTIKGFQIPYWNQLVNMVVQAAKEFPTVRYVGWDASVSDKGPLLIEANAELPGITGFQSYEWNGLDELYTDLKLVKSEYNEKRNNHK